MSGTTSGITVKTGLFRDYNADPQLGADLNQAVENALSIIDQANASATNAAASAAQAANEVATVNAAASTAVQGVNSTASAAQTTINNTVSSATTTINNALATASSASNAASSSASAAASSESNAATSATNAANSASAANTSAQASASSASAASASATNASTSATAASGSATASANSASQAAASATAASGSAAGSATSATNAANSATTAAQIVAGIGNRNLIHNPFFDIQQRGQGPWTAYGVYTLDRWQIVGQGDAIGVSAHECTDADRAAIGDERAQWSLYAGVTGSSAAGSATVIVHKIEAVSGLSSKTVTLSFWAAAAASLPLGIAYAQHFGTGGSPSADVSGSVGVASVTSTWKRFSFTFTLPSMSGKVLGAAGDCTQLVFVLSDQANTWGTGLGVQSGAIRLWGVQLEIGSAPTALEWRDAAIDLALCQRFYQVSGPISLGGVSAAGIQHNSAAFLPAQMRAAPTIAPTFTGEVNVSGANVNSVTANSFAVTVNSNNSSYLITISATLSADI